MKLSALVAALLALALTACGEKAAEAPAVEAAPASPSPFAGWGGVVLASIAFILIVGIAIIVQTRR